jgi:hypothetical protein
LPAPGVAVHNDDAFGSGKGEFNANGAGSAACTKHNNGFLFWINGFCQGLEKALAIGILANEFSISQHGAVHRTHDGSGFTQPVEVLNDSYLMGD